MRTNLKYHPSAETSEVFSKAAISILKFLDKRVPFKLWMVTQLDDEAQIVLEAKGEDGYGPQKGTSVKLSDTFCTHMVKGQGPNIAPNSAEVPIYANSPLFKTMHIGAYIGVPIFLSDGSLYGTLCAIDPQTKNETIKDELPLIKTFADVLGDLMDTEIKANDQAYQAARAKTESVMDTITELYNRRGWDIIACTEEMRARQHGHSLSVVAIDLDNLKKINDTYGHAKGGEYITKAGKAIKDTIRAYDIAARTGGDEFNILLAECDETGAKKIVGDIKYAFEQNGVTASFGIAQFKHSETLLQTMDRADKKMYEDKRAKKSENAA